MLLLPVSAKWEKRKIQKLKTKNKKTSDKITNYLKYSSLAFEMMFIIFLGVFGGREFDKWLDNEKPVFTAVLSVLAVLLALFYAVKDFIKKKKE